MIEKRRSREITAPIILLSLTLTFAMLFVSCDIEPKDSEPSVPGWVTGTVVSLSENVWANGNITSINQKNWYSFTVTEGTTYRIWWNEEGSHGDGTKTGDVVVGARYGNGTFIFGASGTSFSDTAVDNGWSTPQSFTAATSGTVYVRVTSFGTSSNLFLGTFGIVYSTGATRPGSSVPGTWPPADAAPLDENIWADGEVISTTEEIWYSFTVTEGETYRIWWNRTGSSYGDGTKTGNIVVGARYENGTFIFGASGNNFSSISVNNGWSTPQSFTAASSGTVYIRVKSYSTLASNIGAFGIVYSTDSTRPDVPATPWAPSADVVPLDENIWAHGEVTSTSEEIWYSIDVTEGTTYQIWWNRTGSSYGDGTKTGNVVVGARYENGTFIFGASGNNFSGTSVNNGWGTPQSFTAAVSGTVYIRVKSYSTTASNTGTFGIVYSTINARPPINVTPLTENVWTDGNVTRASEEIWYSIDVTEGETYRVWWNRTGTLYGDGSKTGDVVVGARYEDGTFIFGNSGSNFSSTSVNNGWGTPQSFTAASSGTVYIRVATYLTNASYTGTFGIVYSTGSTRPNIPAVPWTPPANATLLDENVWANGNVTSVNEEVWYMFTVTEGETYRIWWNKSGAQGDGTKTGDVVAGARYEDGPFIFGNSGSNFSNTSVMSGWSTPQSFTAAVSGTVYVRVTSYGTASTSYLGTFGIVYSTDSIRPFDMERLIGKWYTVMSGETYDFRPDGRLYILGEDHGVTYTVNGNTISVSGVGTFVSGTATFAVSGSGPSAGLTITNATADTVLVDGGYIRSMPTPLTDGVWAEGTVTSEEVPIYYSFDVSFGTYRIWVDDKDNPSTTRTADVVIMAFDSAGNRLWTDIQDENWITPASFTVTTSGTVYISVLAYPNSTGTFRIVYSTSLSRPF